MTHCLLTCRHVDNPDQGQGAEARPADHFRSPKGAATAARQIDEMKVNVPIIAMTHCEAAKVQGKSRRTATGILCPTQWVEMNNKSDDLFGSASDWNEGFKAAYPSYCQYLIRQPRHLLLFWFGQRLKLPTASTRTLFVMRSPLRNADLLR